MARELADGRLTMDSFGGCTAGAIEARPAEWVDVSKEAGMML